MKKQFEKNTVKQEMAKKSEKAFISVAEIFAGLGCGSRTYEPKIPEQLKK